jgi:hypothetical protein
LWTFFETGTPSPNVVGYIRYRGPEICQRRQAPERPVGCRPDMSAPAGYPARHRTTGQILCNRILLSAFIPYALIRIPVPKMRPHIRIASPHAGRRSRVEMPPLRLQKNRAPVFHLFRRGMRQRRLGQVHLSPMIAAGRPPNLLRAYGSEQKNTRSLRQAQGRHAWGIENT